MKIVHLCLSNFYYDNFSYQENLLVRQNVQDGHDVLVIASLESLDKSGRIKFLKPESYMGNDGAKVIRLEYSGVIPNFIKHKIRSYKGLLDNLVVFKPDVIYFHGLSAYELLTLKKYKKISPEVRIILDCHSDKYNTAISLQAKILHNIFYKPIFKSIVSIIDRIFCISLETMDFAVSYYKAPKEKVDFYPLGGFCLDDNDYFRIRKETRALLNIRNDQIILLHTGKINKKKKIVETLRCFLKNHNEKLVFILAGTLESDIKEDVLSLIEADKRIIYKGWVDSSEIQNLLCASDIYIQPGSQSATMQQSLCLRNAVLLDNVLSHKPFIDNNGWLINDLIELEAIFDKISLGDIDLDEMANNSYNLALNLLDYKVLAKKIYEHNS